MARGGHELPKVLLGHAMPDPSTPFGQPPLKRPYSCFRDGRLQGGWAASVFYPFGHPMPCAPDQELFISILSTICWEERRGGWGEGGAGEGGRDWGARRGEDDMCSNKSNVMKRGKRLDWAMFCC
jgi:hypothetical protein